jgi:pilus assembly protein CpaC
MRAVRGLAMSKVVALAVYIIVVLVATPQAQQPVSFSGSPGAVSGGPAAAAPEATSVDLLVGRSTILNVGTPIARVSLTVPDVADAMVTSPQQLLIHGKAPGTISLFVWDKAGGIKTYEVSVRRDLSQLGDQVRQLFPGEPITVTGNGKDVVLSGTVSTKYVVDKAADVAAGYVEKKENVVNLLKQAEGQSSNQVMLRVRFAEVSRSAMQELGANFVLDRFKNDWDARSTTQQFAAPDFDSSKPGLLTFSDFLNVFVFNAKHGVGAVVRALQTKGLFQSLAEPNLIASNGKEASFLAGGEYPYPVVQPNSGGGSSVTVQFKEFGIRLNFTPTVLAGDLINIKVRPEVSSLDFTNAIVLSGFRLPALATRRTETEVELQDGQTFAIAGLMNNTLNNSMQKIPGIGDIPILGYLFRSRAYKKDQTELVVMITPTIVKRASTGVSAGVPSLVEPFLGAPPKSIAPPAPYMGSPRYPPAGTSAPRTGGDAAAEPQPVPAPAPKAATPAPAPAAATPAPAPRIVEKSVEPPAPKAAARPTPAPKAAAQPAAAPKPVEKPAETPAAPAPASAAVSAAPTQAAPAVNPAPVSVTPAAGAPASQAPAQAAASRPLTKEETKRIEEARTREKKQAEADAKAKAEQDRKAAEQKKSADAKAARDQEKQQKLEAERVKREAVAAKKNADAERKRLEDQKKRDKTLADAAERLRAAQTAYQAEVEKAKANSNDKKNGGETVQ